MEKKIFDNSNLAESYSGVTTPLTFSFARSVYEKVYEEFCDLMGVSRKAIIENKLMFEHMIEFIGFRLYYNLLNWYKMISYLPGYSLNRSFFEKMLGVEKSYHYKKTQKVENKFFEWIRLVWQMLKISIILLNMKNLVNNFNQKFDFYYDQINKQKLKKLKFAELQDLFFETTEKLVGIWKIPIANDLAVMISTGFLSKVTQKWLKDENYAQYLTNLSRKKLISLDPGLNLIRIADRIKKSPKIYEIFKRNSPEKIMRSPNIGLILKLVNPYLKKYGSRSPNELKLEAESLNEKPEMIISLIKTMVMSKNYNSNNQYALIGSVENLPIFKKFTVKFLINWSQASIHQREETRLRRSLIFGFARKVFIEIGKRFFLENRISNPKDIFYLQIEEIFSSTKSFKTIIIKRKKDLAMWKKIDLPRRIETNKDISKLESEFLSNQKQKYKAKAKVQGTVASRGNEEIIIGKTLVIKDFDPNANYKDKILVTCQTDPGWTIIFPLLKAVIVERGGILSHAAIVARELKIPCFVGVSDATDLIPHDKDITLDVVKNKIIYE